MFFKGYVATKNKKCLMKFKDVDANKLLTLKEASKLSEYAGILDAETILIDIDDMKQSNILLDIVDNLQLKCRVYKSTRGMHFLFKNTNVNKCYTHIKLAIGLTADIKVGVKNSYEVLKFNNKEREIVYDKLDDEEYDELPYYLTPIKTKIDFLELKEGDGRNDALFKYVARLQSSNFNKEQCIEILRIINNYLFDKALSEDEFNTITRDELFTNNKEIKNEFFDDNNFLFDKFSEFLMNNASIKLINGTLHIYKDGVYVNGDKYIEQEMIKRIPHLNNSKRSEVIKYLNLIAPEVKTADAYNIAFKNGIYNIIDDSINEFNSDIIITNLIPHNYNEDAYSELADKTLNKLACNDKQIRLLLEEVIGYCFFRRNELRKAFILLGDKSNGKSTFLDMLSHVVGDENKCALDLKEIGDRFRTAEISGKLVNIGDDIDDEFITNTAIFKKAVSGDAITCERKGQDPFITDVYCKFIFSANNMPRIKDKTGAVLDRLVPVPFNATFSKDDEDFDPYIKYKLQDEEVLEYLIKIGVEGLKRVLTNKEFTTNKEIEDERIEINERNNPILLFLKEITEEDIVNKVAKDVYTRYSVWCLENGFQALSYVEFSKLIRSKFDLDIQPRKIDNKSCRIYIKKN
ncbi:MAG: phage/plasmid primase, P4 family [Candidatus Onthovivens sp.]|nr:phage/plasmid primase, P4 family [Candidatus Onthovivens sp.]